MDAAKKAALKDEIFGKHLHTVELDCNRGDQETHPVNSSTSSSACVSAGVPRVAGEDGRNALALAHFRILESVREHHWNGAADESAVGVEGFPAPLGNLFETVRSEAA